jgi:hypothetical protein
MRDEANFGGVEHLIWVREIISWVNIIWNTKQVKLQKTITFLFIYVSTIFQSSF